MTRALSAQLAALRREHAAGMRRPMLGCPMLGDPRMRDEGTEALLIRRACQYAAIMAEREGAISGDLSALDAVFVPPATVIFLRARTLARLRSRGSSCRSG